MINELMLVNPKASVVAVSVLVTLVMVWVTKKFTNQSRMKELKEIQKTCQIKVKENKDDPKELAKVQKEMLDCSMELTKHSMKPLLFTFIPLILLIGWLKGIYVGSEIAKTWIWWYIGSGVFSNLLFRKIFNVV